MVEEELGRSPMCLTIPGLGCSGPAHWQSIWETERSDCQRIELGCWNAPIRNVWVSRIDQAVSAASCPIILVAHSLGCLAVAWWASYVGEAAADVVRAALLVAPPDVDRAGADQRLGRFAPAPQAALPFPSILVASSNDPYASIARSTELAGAWLSDFVDVGELGHINADSGLGAWHEGQALLATLIDHRPPPRDRPMPPRPGSAGFWKYVPRRSTGAATRD
jgi:predicted alpha/beta hydrolase family esterase